MIDERIGQLIDALSAHGVIKEPGILEARAIITAWCGNVFGRAAATPQPDYKALCELAARVLLQHMNDEDYEMSLAGLYTLLTEHKLRHISEGTSEQTAAECAAPSLRPAYLWRCGMCDKRILTFCDFHINQRPTCAECNSEMAPDETIYPPMTDAELKHIRESVAKAMTAKVTASELEIERESDGRWIAEFPRFHGVMAYGATLDEAIRNAAKLLTEAAPPSPADSTLDDDAAWRGI